MDVDGPRRVQVGRDANNVANVQPELRGCRFAEHRLKDGYVGIGGDSFQRKPPLYDGHVVSEVGQAPQVHPGGGPVRIVGGRERDQGKVGVELETRHEPPVSRVHLAQVIFDKIVKRLVGLRQLPLGQRDVVGERQQLGLKSSEPVDLDVERQSLEGGQVNRHRRGKGRRKQDAQEDARQEQPGVLDTSQDELGG